jgi:hypothetical protein
MSDLRGSKMSKMSEPDFYQMSDEQLIKWIEEHNHDNEFDVPDLLEWQYLEDGDEEENQASHDIDREECESIAGELWEKIKPLLFWGGPAF